ncbi:MAG: NADH-quinone oxidoreductase subunit M, partial [bacterium]
MPLLSFIVMAPIAGALIILALPDTMTKTIQRVAIGASAVCMVFSGYLYYVFDKTTPAMQFLEKASWIPSF